MDRNFWILERLKKPQGFVDVVIDTDAFNEIDDQFAIAYALKSSEKLNVKALLAAPFLNEKSMSAEDGMNKSYDEIIKLLSLMKRDDMKEKIYKGSTSFLKDENTPVKSEAVSQLIQLAKIQDPKKPLYVVAIGAITNIASAILIEPSIIKKIVVIWLGGNSLEWPDNREFNLRQDVSAARIVLGSGVPLVLFPCMGVVSSFITTGPELRYWLRGRNELCDYLVENTINEANLVEKSSCWSRVIWDVSAVSWLLEDRFILERYEHCPIPEYDDKWAFDKTRHLIKYVYHINRDELFEDLVKKLIRSN